MNRRMLQAVGSALAAASFAALAQGAIGVSLGAPAEWHPFLAIPLALLTLAWAFLVFRTRREFALLAVGLLAAIAMAGLSGSLRTPAAAIVHAISSHVAFALAVVGAAVTSSSWEARMAVADGGFPSLRSLAWLTPGAVVVQVALGSAYRQKVFGLIPHVSWAFVAALFVMMTAAFTLSQCGKHPSLRRWSIALMSVTGVQFILGVTALVGRMTAGGGAPATTWLVISTTAHVLTGAVVLALTMGLSAQTLRHVEAVADRSLATAGQNG